MFIVEKLSRISFIIRVKNETQTITSLDFLSLWRAIHNGSLNPHCRGFRKWELLTPPSRLRQARLCYYVDWWNYVLTNGPWSELCSFKLTCAFDFGDRKGGAQLPSFSNIKWYTAIMIQVSKITQPCNRDDKPVLLKLWPEDGLKTPKGERPLAQLYSQAGCVTQSCCYSCCWIQPSFADTFGYPHGHLQLSEDPLLTRCASQLILMYFYRVTRKTVPVPWKLPRIITYHTSLVTPTLQRP